MSHAVDPITVSVVQHRLRAIVEEMGEAMLRTSYSQILNSSRDFSTALCDPDGRLIAQAEHVPIHVGALPFAARSVHEFFKGRIRPGDVYLLNDPYRGGNHLPDLTAFVPVFDGDRMAFWSINRSHQSDIGGATHGAYNASATEIFQEGIRIPPLMLYEQGQRREDVYEMIVLNVRHPRDFRGDLAAMIGSARIGERRLGQLLAEFGSATTHAAVAAVLDGAERQVRAIVAGWKDGVYEGEAFLDDDGHGAQRHPYPRARHQAGQRPRHRPDRQPPAGDGLHQLLLRQHPLRGGGGARLSDRSRDPQERRRLPPAEAEAQGGHRRLAEARRAGDVVHQPLRPGDHRGDHPRAGTRMPRAGHGRLGPALPHGRAGRRPAHREAVHLAPVPGAPRAAAAPRRATAGRAPASGRRPAASSSAASRCRRCAFPCISAATSSAPTAAATDATAAARAASSSSSSRPAEPAVGNTAGDGVKYGACGLLGGEDGKPHRYWLQSAGRPDRVLKTKETGIVLRPGDVLHAHSGGGGGWGEPKLRTAEERARDGTLGFVSAEGS